MKPGEDRLASKRFGAALLLAGLLLAACEKEPPPQVTDRLVLTPARFADLPGWAGDRLSDSLPALRRSCATLLRRAADTPVGPPFGGTVDSGALGGTVADWRRPCAALDRLSPGDDQAARAYLEAHFVPFRAGNNEQSRGLITGYYEAELRGARAPGGAYRWPLYGPPADVVKVDLGRFRADLGGERILGRVENGRLIPYHSRAEIEDGALAGRGLEFIWIDDPVDVFFLHVQGSGRVRLPDGRTQRVGFAGSNGLGFYAIGRALIAEGRIPRRSASMQAIRDWLRINPEAATEVMRRNARYIFFRPIDGEGPIGAQGVALTPGRSLAVDPAHLPLGAPIWLDTTWPASDRPLRRLMVAQDSGSAIKGPLRGDFFWGFGEPALEQAGRMKQKGSYYLLLPKSVAERRRSTS